MPGQALSVLKDYYQNLSQFDKAFFPRELALSLEEEEPKLSKVIKACKGIYLRFYAYKGISEFYQTDLVTFALKICEEGKKDGNLDFLVDKLLFLDEPLYEVILNHSRPYLACSIILCLLQLGLSLERFLPALVAFKGNFLLKEIKESLWLRGMSQVLVFFNKLGVLEKEQGGKLFSQMLYLNDPNILARILRRLSSLKVLTQESCAMLLDSSSLANIDLCDINESKILLPQFFDIKHDALTKILVVMQNYALLQGEEGRRNCLVLLQHPALSSVELSLRILEKKGLLKEGFAQDYFEIIITYPLSAYREENLPTLQASDYKRLRALSEVLKRLDKCEFFFSKQSARKHLIQLIEHPSIDELEQIFSFILPTRGTLNSLNLLDGVLAEENFALILRHTRALSFLPYAITRIHFQNHWNAIKVILELKEPEEIIAAMLNRYVNEEILRVNEEGLNDAQSTHTASVHATTELTAWLLLTKMREEEIKIDLSLICKEIKALKPTFETVISAEKDFAESIDNKKEKEQESLVKFEAMLIEAENCLRRLSKVKYFINLKKEHKSTSLILIHKTELHKDKAIQALLPLLAANQEVEEKISLQQFIMFIYTEIKRSGNPDFLYSIVLALFESGRGYNLDENGKDDGLQSQSICLGGMANKFCECLQGLSSLIQFIFINEKSIGLKIRKLFLQTLVDSFRELRARAVEEGEKEKALFCYYLDKLEDIDSAKEVFKALCPQEKILAELHKEFVIWELLKGGGALQKELTIFVTDWLPSLPNIDTQIPPELAYPNLQHFYTIDALKFFHELNQDKIIWKQQLENASSLELVDEKGKVLEVLTGQGVLESKTLPTKNTLSAYQPLSCLQHQITFQDPTEALRTLSPRTGGEGNNEKISYLRELSFMSKPSFENQERDDNLNSILVSSL